MNLFQENYRGILSNFLKKVSIFFFNFRQTTKIVGF